VVELAIRDLKAGAGLEHGKVREAAHYVQPALAG
jgi:hypothetical protein